MKFRTMETDDRLEEIMRALREKRDTRTQTEEPTMVPATTSPTSSNPPPLRPHLRIRHSRTRDNTASRTATQLRPPVMTLKPPQTYERKSRSPNPYDRNQFYDTSTCRTRDVGLDPLTSSASSLGSTRPTRTREEYQTARSQRASEESAEYYTAPTWQSPRSTTPTIGRPMA